MKGMKFVQFDKKGDLSKNCIFRVKCKGKVFNIPMDGGLIERDGSLSPIKEEEERAVDAIKRKVSFSTLIPEIKKEKVEEKAEEEEPKKNVFFP
jgi:hypothetical protein